MKAFLEWLLILAMATVNALLLIHLGQLFVDYLAWKILSGL